jgi:hypothetical protein
MAAAMVKMVQMAVVAVVAHLLLAGIIQEILAVQEVLERLQAFLEVP